MNQGQRVSVIIPTYNRETLIARAIGSVLNQTWQNFELIVVDDGSTDNTEQVVKEFGDERIRYVRHQQNNGPSYARNRGIELAGGAYIAFQDSDDEWMPDKIEKQMQAMLGASEDVGLVYCRMEGHYENGKTGIFPPLEQSADKLRGNMLVTLLDKNVIGTPTMLIRRECMEKTGGFDESLKALEDWELALRIARSWKIELVDEALIKIYPTGSGVSGNVKDYIEARCYMIAKYCDVMLKNNLMNNVVRNVLTVAKEYGCYEEAKQLIAAALQL